MNSVAKEFEAELACIGNSEVRGLVVDIMGKAPDYFLTSPSSMTSKYHPIDEQVEGGKLLHTRRVFWMANELCRSQEFVGVERDCLLGAALLHDLWFRGSQEKPSPYTAKGHEDFVRKYTPDFVGRKYYAEIVRLCEGHGGIWCDNKAARPPKMDPRTLVHVSDYIASRRGVFIPITTKKAESW